MTGLAKPMQLYPELKRDFISRGMKRFLFCLIVFLHIVVFILPALWYFFNLWLKPEEKVISVTLVDSPTGDPNPGGGGPAKSAQANNGSSSSEPSPPPLPNVKPLDNSIPDIPDIPDVANIKIPTPVPRKTPVKQPVTPPVTPKTVKTTPAAKTAPAPVPPKKQPVDMVQQIRRWRSQNQQPGRTAPSKGTSTPSSGSNAAAQRQRMLQELAAQMRGAGGGSGSSGTGTGRGKASGSGTGGIYDPTLSELLRLIDRYWVNPRISSGASPEAVLIVFDIDGRGGISVRSAETTRDPAIDSSVAVLLKKLQTMRITPPEGRRSQSYTVRLRIKEE